MCFSMTTLSQWCGNRMASSGVRPDCPECMSNPLRIRRNSLSPQRDGFTEPSGKRSHQAAVAVPLLEEPFPLERFAVQPIEHIGIYPGTDRLHQVTGETVSVTGVHMQETQSWIEANGSGGKARFRFEQCIKIIEHCIGGIRGKAR